MPSISSMLPIPKVQTQFDIAGNPNDEAWNRRSAKFLDELDWWAEAAKAQKRRAGTPY